MVETLSLNIKVFTTKLLADMTAQMQQDGLTLEQYLLRCKEKYSVDLGKTLRAV